MDVLIQGTDPATRDMLRILVAATMVARSGDLLVEYFKKPLAPRPHGALIG